MLACALDMLMGEQLDGAVHWAAGRKAGPRAGSSKEAGLQAACAEALTRACAWARKGYRGQDMTAGGPARRQLGLNTYNAPPTKCILKAGLLTDSPDQQFSCDSPRLYQWGVWPGGKQIPGRALIQAGLAVGEVRSIRIPCSIFSGRETVNTRFRPANADDSQSEG